MTQRIPCPPAPGPLEGFAAQFDHLFANLAQRQGFRIYLQGLLLPRDRNKTLTALVGTEPIVGAQAAPVQQLQFFLSESTWGAETVNARRLGLLMGDAATAPHENGVLVVDDTGDRKDGTKTAHVARQYLGSIGKIDNGIVAVTTLWADERVYYPLHVEPYTPACRLPKGKNDPAFRTKPQIAVRLVDAALSAGITFRAVVADCFYGENDTFEGALSAAGLPYVLGLKPSHGVWAPVEAVHTPEEAARELHWDGPQAPGDWTKVVRRFHDGHEETWWAADLSFGPYGPDTPRRVMVVTTDPATLPSLATWYLATNLPRPGSPQAVASPVAPADLAEVVRVYGLRTWIEQSYRQVKQELGWADFMVRADQAIRRHWQLVCCAFSFCWHTWFASQEGALAPILQPELAPPLTVASAARQIDAVTPTAEATVGRGENREQYGRTSRHLAGYAFVAGRATTGSRLAGTLAFPLALLAGVVRLAPAAGATGAPRLGW
jgi:SRSO17 transposase